MTNLLHGLRLPRRHLLDPWRDAFVLELRLLEVGGARIGDALAEVDTHCADSGQTPQEAFGDPAGYARAVADGLSGSAGTARSLRVPWPRAAATATGTIVGVLGVLSGAAAVAHGERARVSAGALASLAVIVLVVTGFVALLPRLARHRTAMFAVLAVGWLGAMLPQVFWTGTAVSGPGWLVLGVGLLGFAATWLALRGAVVDEVTDPRTGRPSFQLPRRTQLSLRWGLPGMLVVAVALAVLVR